MPPGGADDVKRLREFERQIQARQFLQVESALRAYLTERPDSWWAHYALGYVLLAQKRVGDSIRSLAQSLRLHLANAAAHKTLGRALVLVGAYERAQIEFEQAIRLKPGCAELHYNLGQVHSAQDNFPPARQSFEKAVELNPGYIAAHNALGLVLESMGEDDAAIASYRRAIELNSERQAGFAAPYVNMSAYFNRLGDPERALEYGAKALEVDQDSDLALYQMAKAHRTRQSRPEAAEALEKAISLNARISRYYYLLSAVYRRLGRAEESEEALATFQKLEHESAQTEKRTKNAL